MTYFLTKFQWGFYNFLTYLLKNLPPFFDPIFIFILFAGLPTFLLNYLLWKKKKKDIGTLFEFYAVLVIGLLLSQPIHLLFTLLFIGYRETLIEFLSLEGIFDMKIGILFTFFYFILRKKNIFDTYDTILPFLFLFHFLFHFFAFGLGWSSGKPTSSTFGVIFHPKSEAGKLFPYPIHPITLYHSVFGLVVFLFLLWLLKRRKFEGEVSLWIAFFGGGMKVYEKLVIEKLSILKWVGKYTFVLSIFVSGLSVILLVSSYIKNKRLSSFK